MKAVKSNSKRQLSTISRSDASIGGANRPKRRNPSVSPPTTIELRGVPVHFPFQPYKCQEDYMGKVMDALLRRENALLESPTGTGKTLCLLCSTLAWQREEARQLHQRVGAAPSGVPLPATSNEAQPRPVSSRRVPTIIYASRTHSQLSQVVRELANTRYRPKHAVLGSREQMCVNPKVKRAGSIAADINHDCNRLGQERRCKYRNGLDGFTPPSNESGGGGTSFYGTQPVMDMEDLVSMGQKHKVCPFYYTRSLVEEAELILVPYNYLFDKDARKTTLSDVPWDNSVIIFDEAHNLESFASDSASFDLSTTDIAGCLAEIQRAVNIVQMFGSADEGKGSLRPENIAKIKTIFLKFEEYIMNSLSQQTSSYKGEFIMEIFQKACGINYANHELFIKEVQKLTEVFMQFGGGAGGSSSSGSGMGKSGGAPKLDGFIQCIKRVFGEPTEARCIAKAQSYRVHISSKQSMQTNSGSNAAKGPKQNVVGRTISYWCFAPSEAMRELANLNVRSLLVTSGTLSPLESYALELDLPFPNRLENPHIISDDQIHVRVVGKGVSKQVLTSSYERRQDPTYYTELGNTLISLGKVIPGGMLVFFPSYGVMETCLERWGGPSSNFSRQQSSKAGSSFFAARKKRPTGTARFSFPYAPNTFSTSKETLDPWRRLLGVKAVVVEPKSTANLPDAIQEFHKYLNMPKSKGVALFGVCRGKISEGIDFAHDMCRAVIITGLPFAPSFDPKVRMKREFLDQNRSTQNQKASSDGGFGAKARAQNLSLSGHEWYTQQAHRAVNQAIGRVIRNKDDYGAILLLDNRFSLPGNQQGLSKWVRSRVLPDEGIGRTIGSLAKFYKQAAKNAEEREKKRPPPLPEPNRVSVILKYEEDEEQKENFENGVDAAEDRITKVAIVTKNDGGENASVTGNETSSPSRSYIRPESIIARVDMKTREGAEILSKETEGPSESKSSPQCAKSEAQIPFAPSDGNKSERPDKKPKSAIRKESSQSISPARRFFQLVQTRMTVHEQSKIKRAAVALKDLTGAKHLKAFLRASGVIIKTILIYDKFENRSRENKPEMLELLMQLFPLHFLQDAQKWTMAIVFDGSTLGATIRDAIDKETYRKIRLAMICLLRECWYKNGQEGYVASHLFLSKLEKILSTVFQIDAKLRRDIASNISGVLPQELQGTAAALFDQMKASMRMSQLKARDKVVLGEDAIDMGQFLNVTVKNEGGSDDIQTTTMKYNQSLPEKRLRTSIKTEEQELRKQGSKRANPYSNVNAVSRGSSMHENPPSKVQRNSFLSSLCAAKQPRPFDSVKKALLESESDTFTGKSSLAASLKNNTPKGMKCQICETQCEKLLISECNHHACNGCWLTWLKKSPTCPLCRKPAAVETLAHVVYKKS